MLLRVLAIYSSLATLALYLVLTNSFSVSSASTVGSRDAAGVRDAATPSIAGGRAMSAADSGVAGMRTESARASLGSGGCSCEPVAGESAEGRISVAPIIIDEESGLDYELDDARSRAAEIEMSIKQSMEEVERHLTGLSPEIRSRLLQYYRAREELNRSPEMPVEELERRSAELGTEDDILGPSLTRQLQDSRLEEQNRYQRRMNEKEIQYLVHSLHLSADQETELRATYDNPERYADVDTVNLALAVRLRDSQMNDLRRVLSRDFSTEAVEYVNGLGGEEMVPQELRSDDGAGGYVTDWGKISNTLRRKALQEFLSDEEFNRFLEWEASNEGF